MTNGHSQPLLHGGSETLLMTTLSLVRILYQPRAERKHKYLSNSEGNDSVFSFTSLTYPALIGAHTGQLPIHSPSTTQISKNHRTFLPSKKSTPPPKVLTQSASQTPLLKLTARMTSCPLLLSPDSPPLQNAKPIRKNRDQLGELCLCSSAAFVRLQHTLFGSLSTFDLLEAVYAHLIEPISPFSF